MRNNRPTSGVPRQPAMRAAGAALAVMFSLSLGGCGGKGGAPPPPVAPPAIAAAYADIEAKRPDDALAKSAAILAADRPRPEQAEAYYVRGRALEVKAAAAADPGEARHHLIWAGDAYVKALRLSPPPALEALAHAGLANVAFFLDDFPTAVKEWSAAIPLTTDDDTKAWILYRLGLSQQRGGAFDAADRTFDRVETQLADAAGGEPARLAAAARGARAFFVQAGTFTSAAAADREAKNLRQYGVLATAVPDPATGKHVVRVGPIPTFPGARQIQARLAPRHRDAVILP
ncbi:MAG TPA: SPOR domain-containing protein [Humisphaera sp.]